MEHVKPGINIDRLILQLVDTLQYIHSLEYLHGDLSLSNIMILNNSSSSNNLNMLKLLDFSFSTRTHRSGNISKPTIYICPIEMFIPTIPKQQNIDIWMAGCILYFMTTNTPLFDSENDASHIENIYKNIGIPNISFFNKKSTNSEQIINGKINSTLIELMDSKSNMLLNKIKIFPEYEIMRQMLQLNPNKRISATKIIETNFIKKIAQSNNFNFTHTYLHKNFKTFNTNVLPLLKKMQVIDFISSLQLGSFEIIIHVIINLSRYFIKINTNINTVSDDYFWLIVCIMIGLSSKIITNNDFNINTVINILKMHNIKTSFHIIKSISMNIYYQLDWDLDIFTSHDYILHIGEKCKKCKKFYTFIELLILLLPIQLNEFNKAILINKLIKISSLSAKNKFDDIVKKINFNNVLHDFHFQELCNNINNFLFNETDKDIELRLFVDFYVQKYDMTNQFYILTKINFNKKS